MTGIPGDAVVMKRPTPFTIVHACLAWLALCATTAASAAPRVADIRIVGNETTRDIVILRELALAVGDEATPQALEDTRQSVQDLGLFREVRIETEPSGDEVVLLVRVREKRYFLPIPRIDGNSDGDYSYGAQIRWSNMFGLNHRMVAYVEKGEIESERDRESTKSARLSYSAPYLGDTPYSLNVLLDHTEQVSINRQDRTFDETFRRVQVLGTRDFRTARPRNGWILGTGLYWQDQSAKGPFAPPSDGMATAGVVTASYDDLHFNFYSQTGKRFQARAEVAVDGLMSDYGYQRLDLDYRDYRPFGRRDHQSLHFIAAGGVYGGGPDSRNAYSLGGSRRMRGYESDAIEGNSYWYVSGEYLRPLRWNWLRLLAVFEAGSARGNVFGDRNRSAYASIGLGLRARITWFVDIEIEAGIAMPLIAGDGARFFASTL